jgi:hypothetical protein
MVLGYKICSQERTMDDFYFKFDVYPCTLSSLQFRRPRENGATSKSKWDRDYQAVCVCTYASGPTTMHPSIKNTKESAPTMDLSREESSLRHALLRPSHQSEDDDDDDDDDDENDDSDEEDGEYEDAVGNNGSMLGMLLRRRRAGRMLRSCCPPHQQQQQQQPPPNDDHHAILPTSSFRRTSLNCSNYWCPGILSSSSRSAVAASAHDHAGHTYPTGYTTTPLTFLDRYLRLLEQCRFLYLAMIVLVLWPAGSHSLKRLQEKVESSFSPMENTPSGRAQEAFRTAYRDSMLDPMNPPLLLVLDSRQDNASLIAPPIVVVGGIHDDADANTTTSAYDRAKNFSTTLQHHLETSICWRWTDTPRHECAHDGDWLAVTSYYSFMDTDRIDLPWIATHALATGPTTILVQVSYTFPSNETLHHKHRVVQLMQAIDDYYHNETYGYEPYFCLSYTGVKYLLSDLVKSTRHDLKRMDALVLPAALILMGLVLPRANFWIVWMVPVVTLLSTVSFWSILMNVIATRYQVSTFCPTVMMSLTMGLGIDYSLFLLSRYLQNESIADMLSSMSRVLAVSGLTLACTFAGLMLLPVSTLQSIGFGAVVAIATSLIVNLITVPILLMTPLGKWIIRKDPIRVHRRCRPDHGVATSSSSFSSTETPPRTLLPQPQPMPSIWFRIAKTVLHPYKGIILLLVLFQPITLIAERAWSLKTSRLT